MKLSRAEQIAAVVLAVYGTACAVAVVAGPAPHPSFAIAASLAYLGAVAAIKP